METQTGKALAFLVLSRKERKMTVKEFAEVISEGTKSLYNTITGMLLITDLVDGAGRENEEYGMRAGNGDWLFGVMSCTVDPAKREEYEAEFGCLMEYALAYIPAPGTFVKPRMDFTGTSSIADIMDIAENMLTEYPDGWEVV